MKTAIIGGGIGGLVTALYLSKDGHDVTIYEKEHQAGGRLAFVERDGFKVDKGPTIVLLPDMIRTILAETGVNPEIVQMERIDPLYPIHFSDGTTFTKWSDTTEQLKEIRSVFPGEEEGFLQYMKDMKERFEKGKPAFMDRDFRDRKSFFSRTNMKTLIKLKAYQSVKVQSKQYFSNKKMQEAFSLQTLYIGGSPEETPAIYSLVPFSEHYHGIWYVKGGYASLVNVITKELIKRGVKVETNALVSEIETTQKQASAVKVNGKREAFDSFIINGDFPVARTLVKEKKRRSFAPSSGCLLLYFGLKGELRTDHVHQFFMGKELDQNMKEIFERRTLPEDPSFYVFSPSKIDPTLAPDGHSSAYVLVPVPSGDHITQKDYEDYADKITGLIESRMDPELKEKVVWKEIRTPNDAMQEGLFDGGSFGLAPSLFQSGVFRPQLQPFSYENVYAVGASIHPGGGVPIVMQGAKLLAEAIREKESRASTLA
ncbi:phytoene desaturase family protein [Alteribacter keqinensis]|uniref:Phytoene desaturase n=1 Tax=Alteribacter keqinensis TaxID=2483800 RepID=A0A3M7TU31_9BACI|nr:phytoene desaturase family protein [Alteribacter keqinensis]RNA69037.1 phytoene desaturase [Alteribacter keqinensis]